LDIGLRFWNEAINRRSGCHTNIETAILGGLVPAPRDGGRRQDTSAHFRFAEMPDQAAKSVSLKAAMSSPVISNIG